MKEKDYSSDEENLQDDDEIIDIPENQQKLLPFKKKIEFEPKKSLDGKEKKIKEKVYSKEIHNSYLFNIKDYIFFFFLMISSSINFSYLYLPFIFFGIIYIFLLGNNSDCSKKFKFSIEIISVIYSILLVGFKISSIVLIIKDNSFIKEYEDLLFNLGVCYYRDKNSTFYFIMTFLGEGIMLIISIFSIVVSTVYGEFRKENDASLIFNKFWEIRKLILLNYVFICSFAVFNVSYLTLFYMCLLQLVFFLDSLTDNRTKTLKFFKFVCFLFTGIIIIQIAAINVLNIPKFQEEILNKNVINEKIYSVWTQIGINYAYHKKLIYVLKEWIGYLAAVCSLMTLTFSINTIKVNSQNDTKDINNLENQKSILQHNNKEGEKIEQNIIKKKNICSNIVKYIKKIFKNIYIFITSPVFIIQFSRVMSIAWMYFYRNFYSLGIFLSVFFSFLFIDTAKNKYLTIYLLTPMVFSTLVCFHFSNINGFFEDYEGEQKIKFLHFGLGKYEYTFLEYYAGNLYYIFIMFLIYSFYNSTQNDKNEIRRESLEDEKINPPSLNESGPIKKSVKSFDDNIKIILSNGTEKEEKKEEKKKIQDLSLVNIILKYIFSNVDKITLIVMYLVAVKSINILHLELVVIFLVQILFPNKLKYLFVIILCILQLLFLSELIVDLLKVYYLQEFNNNKSFMNFLLIYTEGLSDNNIEIFIYSVVYCFYFQYQIYNFPFLKRIIENKELTLANYVEFKFNRFNRIKRILYLIGNIILELYIWILIGLFVFISCFFEINLIFAFKLAWFFLLAFIFLKKVQNPKNNNNTFSLFWHSLFLAFCCINTLAVYIYQFISNDYINLYNDIKKSTNFFLQNLPNIGFTMYNKDDLYFQFLPHFGIIFISVLFIFEIRCQLKKLRESKNQKKKKTEEIKDDFYKKLKEKKTEEEKDILKAKRYESNKKLLRTLSITYFIVNFIKMLTKFYWLLLFFIIGIIFSIYDLSCSMIIYMLIFGITFICMFHRIIKKLTNYINKPSYFITKVIRYSLVETPLNINQNKYFRSIAFIFLLSYSFIFFILLYLYGVFDLFQHGCNPKFFKGCEERHDPIFEIDGEIETNIKAYSYLFGIYVNIRKEGLMNVAWIHLLLSALIGFDVYAQKLENKYTEDSENIKAKMQKINNENNTLYFYSQMADTNILIKLGLLLAGINNNKFNDELRETMKIKKKGIEERNFDEINTEINTEIKKNTKEQKGEEEINLVDLENEEEKDFLKREKIKSFLNIFSKAINNEQTLSDRNNGTRFIWFVKKLFEEIIIFLLICMALTKLNVLSFVYLIYSAYLTKNKKTMMKFYILYCFLLVLIIIQSIIYLSNISEKTCPRPNTELLEILKNKLKIPWYKNYLDLEDSHAFFYGFGVNKIQIILILLEFVQIIVIYIYLYFFSYSIYQDVTNKGKSKKIGEKFNFGAIKLSSEKKAQVRNMERKVFEQYRDCLRNNFDFDIGETLDIFKNKLNLDLNNDLIESIEKKDDIPKTNNEELNKLIIYKVDLFQKKEKNKDNIPDSNLVKFLNELIYLYFHCFILLLIIIDSLMITGLLSIFYIIICFSYLINADKIHSGKTYGYPNAIKRLLKICVLIDITLQIIYQIPFLSPDKDSLFQKIFDVFGLIKIIDYNTNNEKEIELISEGIFEIIGKSFIFFFLSLQRIIYNSKDFKKYYLTFLLSQKYEFTKNALINSFRFNNDRINAFKSSMNLRIKSEKAMDKLKLTLERWNEKLNLGGENVFEQPKQRPLEFIRETERKKEEEEKKKLEENNNINNNINNDNDILDLFNTQNNNNNIEKEEDRILQSVGEKGAVGLMEELNIMNRKKVKPDEIKKRIKKILLDGYITKFYLWFNEHSINYKYMPEKKKKSF